MNLFKSMVAKSGNIYFFLFSFFFIFYFYTFVYLDRTPIPFDSHYYVANLKEAALSLDNSIVSIYGMLKSPIYGLLGGMYSIPGFYFLLLVIFLTLNSLVLYCFLLKVAKQKVLAFIFSFVLNPFTRDLLLEFDFFSFLNSESFVNIYFYLYPIHLGLDTYSFSVRLVFGLLYLVGICLFLDQKYNKFFICLIVMFLAHPNNAIGAFSIFCFTYFIQKITAKDFRLKPVLNWLAILAIGLIPAFIKVFHLNENISGYSGLTGSGWYFEMIRDEADDFSSLYYLIFQSKSVLIFFICSIFSFVVFKKFDRSSLKYLSISPLVIFLVHLLLEVLLQEFNIDIFSSLVISTQFGMKIANFALWFWVAAIALLISKLRMVVRVESVLVRKKIIQVFTVIIVIGFLNSYYTSKRFLNYKKKTLIFKRLSMFKYFKETKYSANPTMQPIVDYSLSEPGCERRLDGIKTITLMSEYQANPCLNTKLNLDYYKKFNKFVVFEALVSSVSDNLKDGDGMIIPPYLKLMRDLFPRQKIFFQEKHDGNLMLGSKKITEFFLPRMKLLFNGTYLNIHPLELKTNFSYMRKKFLELREENIMEIQKKYPKFQYFLTEDTHQLNFEVIFNSKGYVLYKIPSSEI